jgi:antitoxin MazE
MKTQIIQIGNSQGIRIPKALLEESGITGDVNLELTDDGILIRNISKPRSGWSDAFRAMAEHDDDSPLENVPTSGFEKKEWQW